MNIGGGEAADQMVRMMLTGTEVTVRLGASALKNLLAITLALAKHHKTLSGKVNMGKMLRETRDIRMFPMSPEQYQAFKQRAVKQKILFSVIRDSDGRGKVVDVAMPVTELERAHSIPPAGSPEYTNQGASPHAGFRDPGGKNAKKRASVGVRLGRYQRQLQYIQERNQYGDDS